MIGLRFLALRATTFFLFFLKLPLLQHPDKEILKNRAPRHSRHIPLGSQQGCQCKHDLSELTILPRQTGGKKQQQKKEGDINNKYNGRCCGDMQEENKKKLKTLTATTQEYLLGLGAVRAVWILSAMKARGAAGRRRLNVHTAARSGRCGQPASRRAEREVQWASSTLARKKNKGRHYASSHMYSLAHPHTRTRVQTHVILCKTTTAKA